VTVRVLVGDCRAVLAKMPSESVQCVVTSPPYYGLRDYGTAKWEGGDAGCNHIYNHGAQGKTGQRAERTFTAQAVYKHECRKCGAVRLDSQIGLEKTPAEYVEQLVFVFREVRRVLRDDGTLWLNLGDSYAAGNGIGRNDAGRNFTGGGGNILGSGNPGRQGTHERITGLKPKDLCGIPWRVAFALQADGWWLRSEIVWAKGSPMPESVRDRPTKSHEQVFLLTKRARYFYDGEAIAEPVSADEGRPAGVVRDRMFGYDSKQATLGQNRGGILSSATPTRNARSVWTINAQPFPESHFATMPPELARRCILAGSAARACEVCGAAWGRVVERETVRQQFESRGIFAHRPGADGYAAATGSTQMHDKTSGIGSSNSHDFPRVPLVRTVGWEPRCSCLNSLGTARSVVLDPFGGAGTTGLVADRLGRDAILVELNPEYAAMARERVRNDNPLFTDVA
jgi:DNA modification methylase